MKLKDGKAPGDDGIIPEFLKNVANEISVPLGMIYTKSLAEGAPCALRGCKNGPAPFPGLMSYKATKPGLVCLSCCIIQPVGENSNTMHTMRMTSSKCVLQQRHLLCYESEPDP